MRVRVPVLITVFVGLFMVLKFFLNVPWIHATANELEQWCLIIFAAATILGVGNILRVNLRIVFKKQKDWQYKLILVISLLAMAGVGLVELITRGDVAAGSFFNTLYETLYTPLAASMFALLAFYIASAAFRAFRARNIRAALLLASAALVMIGRVPLGGWLSGVFPRMAGWLMAYPNAAGQRALIIGAAIGVIATGLRILFGIERPYLRGQ